MTTAIAPSARISAARNDTELVEQAQRGDELAFRTIMERHNRRLYRVARTVLKDESEAEDAVQEAYLRAFSALSTFRGEASLATWLTRIVLNEALGRKRKQRPMLPLDDIQEGGAQIIRFPNMNPEIDPERSAAQSQIRTLIEKSIDALPDSFRIVFVLRDVEELSIEETAAFLGVRPETIKTRLHRARRLLREQLTEQLASTLKDSFPVAGARCARISDSVISRLRSAGRLSGPQ